MNHSPYYADESVTLYHGDCREILPELDLQAQICITDPPYGDTTLAWDVWPEGWVSALESILPPTTTLWCFGSMRMHLKHRSEFNNWRYAQEVIWQKQMGSGFGTDRFIRVHEIALQWYRGKWTDLVRDTPRVASTFPERGMVSTSRAGTATRSQLDRTPWIDDGTRLQQSVIKVRNMHHAAQHPTEKPLGILSPLVEYSSKLGDVILDPFAGSGSTLLAATMAGRGSVGVEANEAYCELIAKRLSQGVLDFGEPA